MALDWSIPIKTDWMLEQSAHQPSMAYAKDIYKVVSQLENFTALEIGAAWGFSTLAILEAGAKHLTSVDNNLAIKAPAEVEASGYKNWVWNCVKSEQFWRENSIKYDLIYVDGSHLYDDVRNDLYEGWKHLEKDGLLLVDDWDHKKNIKSENNTTEYGVSLACWEFWRDHPCKAGIEGRILWFRK